MVHSTKLANFNWFNLVDSLHSSIRTKIGYFQCLLTFKIAFFGDFTKNPFNKGLLTMVYLTKLANISFGSLHSHLEAKYDNRTTLILFKQKIELFSRTVPNGGLKPWSTPPNELIPVFWRRYLISKLRYRKFDF